MALPDLYVNGFDHRLWLAVVCISFNPFYWNVVCSLISHVYEHQYTLLFCIQALYYFTLAISFIYIHYLVNHCFVATVLWWNWRTRKVK